MSNICYQSVEQDTVGEIIANSLTHGIGAGLSIAGFVVLVLWAGEYGNAWHRISFPIFGSSLILLYLASTLYHSLPMPRVKYVFRIIDHAAIYVLIAGTYTPFMLVALRGPWGWSFLGIVWAAAILGVLLKIFYMAKFEKSSLVLYVAMGWLCVLVIPELVMHLPQLSLILLICGGLAYTIGLIFYGWGKLPYHHAVWHLFVLGGSICHYGAVLAML
jgi:hemolysin III